jgi:hypothetical protein
MKRSHKTPSEAQAPDTGDEELPLESVHLLSRYKGVKFSRRTVDEVKKDIDSMEKEYASYKNTIRSAFLQDADSLVLKTSDILEIIRYTKEKFPGLERITTYARATTLKRKTVEELRELCKAGLTRIHVGTGKRLGEGPKMIRKVSTRGHRRSGRKVVEAGISLSDT